MNIKPLFLPVGIRHIIIAAAVERYGCMLVHERRTLDAPFVRTCPDQLKTWRKIAGCRQLDVPYDVPPNCQERDTHAFQCKSRSRAGQGESLPRAWAHSSYCCLGTKKRGCSLFIPVVGSIAHLFLGKDRQPSHLWYHPPPRCVIQSSKSACIAYPGHMCCTCMELLQLARKIDWWPSVTFCRGHLMFY